MLQFPYFQQECPICGRPVRVRNEHLGCRVTCLHCRGRFVASDPVGSGGLAAGRNDILLRRADSLLASTPIAAR